MNRRKLKAKDKSVVVELWFIKNQDLRSYYLKKFKNLYYSECYDFNCPLNFKRFQLTV